jgi:hypothetical protein
VNLGESYDDGLSTSADWVVGEYQEGIIMYKDESFGISSAAYYRNSRDSGLETDIILFDKNMSCIHITYKIYHDVI